MSEYTLSLTESLVLEVCQARRRLGEPVWTFERNPPTTNVLRRLQAWGYLSFEQDPAGNWRVHLNDDPDGPAAKWAVPVGERCYRCHTDDEAARMAPAPAEIVESYMCGKVGCRSCPHAEMEHGYGGFGPPSGVFVSAPEVVSLVLPERVGGRDDVAALGLPESLAATDVRVDATRAVHLTQSFVDGLVKATIGVGGAATLAVYGLGRVEHREFFSASARHRGCSHLLDLRRPADEMPPDWLKIDMLTRGPDSPGLWQRFCNRRADRRARREPADVS